MVPVAWAGLRALAELAALGAWAALVVSVVLEAWAALRVLGVPVVWAVLGVAPSEMTAPKRREVRCSQCSKAFWVEETDHRLMDGPFTCGVCDLAGWDDVAVFTGPAEMILVDGSGGETLLDVLDSLGSERVRVIVLQKKRSTSEVN